MKMREVLFELSYGMRIPPFLKEACLCANTRPPFSCFLP